MRAVVAAKFAPGTLLAARLECTGNAHLEEGNHHGDNFWGTCKGHGKNWLGLILMEVRKANRALAAGALAGHH